MKDVKLLPVAASRIETAFEGFLEFQHDLDNFLITEPSGIFVVGVLWRRHIKTLTTTFLTGNRGKAITTPILWFAGRTKQHIRCLAAPIHVELLF